MRDSMVRVTVYAPVEEAFPHIVCGDSVRAKRSSFS
jgi:hypothetical protein